MGREIGSKGRAPLKVFDWNMRGESSQLQTAASREMESSRIL